MHVKSILKNYMPFSSHLLPAYRRIRDAHTQIKLKTQGRSATFTEYYKTNKWKDPHSRSGAGSNLEQTEKVREILPKLIEAYDIHSVLDIPCGDFFWMKEVDFPPHINYTGADIVEPMIKDNQANYTTPHINFLHLDMCEDNLPQADLIFCRDALVHLSFSDVKKAIENIKKSGSKYLLTTTFTDRNENQDIVSGQWRTLNLEIEPFNFPKPLEIYNENYAEQEERYIDKSIALWDISNL